MELEEQMLSLFQENFKDTGFNLISLLSVVASFSLFLWPPYELIEHDGFLINTAAANVDCNVPEQSGVYSVKENYFEKIQKCGKKLNFCQNCLQ